MKVPFAIPDCGVKEINEVIAVIKSGWLTTASRCAQFEKEFARFVGAKHALAVNSATGSPSSRPGGVKRGVRYAKVATNIPDDLYKKIEEEVKLGMFSELKELENIRR